VKIIFPPLRGSPLGYTGQGDVKVMDERFLP